MSDGLPVYSLMRRAMSAMTEHRVSSRAHIVLYSDGSGAMLGDTINTDNAKLAQWDDFEQMIISLNHAIDFPPTDK